MPTTAAATGVLRLPWGGTTHLRWCVERRQRTGAAKTLVVSGNDISGLLVCLFAGLVGRFVLRVFVDVVEGIRGVPQVRVGRVGVKRNGFGHGVARVAQRLG